MKSIATSIAIRKVVVCLGTLLVTVGAARSAAAQTPPPPPPAAYSNGGGIGLGASRFLSGLNGVQVDYDTYAWDLEGLFAFADRDTGNNMSRTYLQAGVRGWFHLHHGASSDFSVGGGLGFLNASGGGMNSATTTLIEPGVRARVFVTPNVAVHAVLGLSIEIGDNNGGADYSTGVALMGQPLFVVGFTYYFH